MEVHIQLDVFNQAYLPLLDDEEHRYLVLYGGAGSGKSVFAVQRFLVRMLQKELCNILAVRAVAATNRDSTYALFRQVIAKWGLGELFHCADSDLRITCANGNSVIFKGLDDTEKLKSVTWPVTSNSITQEKQSLSTPGLREQIPLESCRGSIGTTVPGV